MTRRAAVLLPAALAAFAAGEASMRARPSTAGARSAGTAPGDVVASRPAGAAPSVEPFPVAPGLAILPRQSWGADLKPKGSFEREDVKFLLVHHTASPNVKPKGGWRDVIRQAYAWQTGPAKGWNDVCYHWFVDPDGVVYEGRAGGLMEPLRADATGGNQGYAQLVCLIGDFTSTMPTPAAQRSLIRTLAWLATRYDIDTSPNATATFVSRGSNRWKAGSNVITATIAAHRAMTFTACPGNTFAPIIERQYQAKVHAARARPRLASSVLRFS